MWKVCRSATSLPSLEPTATQNNMRLTWRGSWEWSPRRCSSESAGGCREFICVEFEARLLRSEAEPTTIGSVVPRFYLFPFISSLLDPAILRVYMERSESVGFSTQTGDFECAGRGASTSI